MRNGLDYLLKYVSNETLGVMKKRYSSYILESLEDERVNIEYNLRYFLKYGIKDIDNICLKNIDDVLLEHDKLIEKINNYESKLSKNDVIMMYDNM